MAVVPEPETVWMVELGRGEPTEVKGELALEHDALVFTESGTGGASFKAELTRIRSARRVRGSPILMVVDESGAGVRRTAFYFAQPPPLTPPEPGTEPLPGAGLNARPTAGFGAMRRTSKRRHMRTNIGYLAASSSGKKPVIKRWVAELRAAIRPPAGNN
jgi:hypothetical protein